MTNSRPTVSPDGSCTGEMARSKTRPSSEISPRCEALSAYGPSASPQGGGRAARGLPRDCGDSSPITFAAAALNPASMPGPSMMREASSIAWKMTSLTIGTMSSDRTR
jgi:hypothetical protein